MTQTHTTPAPQGGLTIYLGAAPGGGKTFAMLMEGRDLRADGDDVLLGVVDTRGRPRTSDAIGTLEFAPRAPEMGRDQLDCDAIIERHPATILIDDIAYTPTNDEPRWKSVQRLRAAGINVIATVDVTALESLADVVEDLTGEPVIQTVPDSVVDDATDVRFVDITPEALHKRALHGNIYPGVHEIPTSSRLFDVSTLAGLRELGLQRVADHLHGSVEAPPQHVVVAVSGRPGSMALIRRAARLARRFRGLCTVVHVLNDTASEPRWREVAENLQCALIEVDGEPISAVVSAVEHRGALHVVVGEQAVRNSGLFSHGTVDDLISALPKVNIHVIAHAGRGRRPKAAAVLPATAQAPPAEAVPQGATAPGALRLYLGAVRGVGTTTAMLAEAQRRRGRGTDVIIGALDPTRSGDVPSGVSVIPHGKGGTLDVTRVLARKPDVVCIDSIAALASDGTPVVDAVADLIHAGIMVLGTVLLTDLESMRPRLAELGIGPTGKHPVGDEVLHAARDVEVIDVTVEEIQERLRNGAIVPIDHIDAALNGTYSKRNIQALREETLVRASRLSDKKMASYVGGVDPGGLREAHLRVAVAVSIREGGLDLIRAAASMAGVRGQDLVVLTVVQPGRHRPSDEDIEHYQEVTESLGATFVRRDGKDPVGAIVEFLHQNLVSELVVRRVRASSRTIGRLVSAVDGVDVHIFPTV